MWKAGVIAALVLIAACDVLPSSEDKCTIPVVRITGVDVTPLDREERDGQIHYFYSDTLRGQVVFQAQTDYEKIGEETVTCPSGPLVDPVPGKVVNPVERFGHVVQFDRPIRAHGATVPAKTNLLEVTALQEDYGIRKRIGPFGISEVRFDPAIYTFLEDSYRGTFAWITSEGEVMGDSVTVYIDLR